MFSALAAYGLEACKLAPWQPVLTALHMIPSLQPAQQALELQQQGSNLWGPWRTGRLQGSCRTCG